MKQKKPPSARQKSRFTFDRLILPIFIAILAFFIIMSLYHLSLDIKDLIKVEGEVSAVRMEEERDAKGRIQTNCYVYLRQGSFKIMDDAVFEASRQAIIHRVQPGDRVTLYLRNHVKNPFGLGTANLIYQLEHRGEVLMPLSVMKTNFRWILAFCVTIILLLIGVQIYQHHRSRSPG